MTHAQGLELDVLVRTAFSSKGLHITTGMYDMSGTQDTSDTNTEWKFACTDYTHTSMEWQTAWNNNLEILKCQVAIHESGIIIRSKDYELVKTVLNFLISRL